MTGGEEYKGRNQQAQQEQRPGELGSSRSKSALSLDRQKHKEVSDLQAENRRLRQAFELLQGSYEEVSHLLTATELPALFVDTDLKLRRFTPAAAVLMRICEADLGRELAQALGRFRCLGLHEDAVETLRTGRGREAEVRSDEGRWVVKRCRPVRDEQGQIEGVVFTFTDQTRRVQNEADLRQELRFREALLQTIPSPVFWKDIQGRYLGCNQTFASDVLDLSAQQIRGKSFSQLAQAIPSELAQIYRRKDQELLRTGGTQVYQAQVAFARARRRQIEFRKAVFFDETGQPAGIVGVMLERGPDGGESETTEIVQTEAAEGQARPIAKPLDDESEKFRAIAEYSYDWEHWCGIDGKLFWVNAAIERHTGYSVNECYDMSNYPVDLIHPADRRRVEGLFRQAVEWGTSGNDVLCRVVTKKGQTRWFSVSWLPIYDSNHRCCGHRAGFRDVTGRILAQRNRERIDMQVQQGRNLESTARLASRLSHDFNNLLTSILGNAQLAQADAQEGTGLRESIDEIIEAGNRAAQMCMQLRRLAGNAPLRMKAEKLEELVQAGLKQVEKQRSLNLVEAARVDPELETIPCDRSQMQDLIAHLVSNAVEACRDNGGKVRLAAYPTQIQDATSLTWQSPEMKHHDLCCIEVVDEGEGMDDETLRRAFDPFFTTRSDARGLGLAICLGVIRSHGGGLWVDSTPRQGSVFRVYLPRRVSG